MPCRHLGLLLIVPLAVGPFVAQDAVESPPAPTRVRDVPCVIDAQLSLWLALESADRMIGALEAERRDLADELATALKALDVLGRADDADGVPLTDLTALVQAQVAGRAAIEDAYAEAQNRLIEIDKTLVRRRKQQAMLEAQIEAAMETRRPADPAGTGSPR